MPHPTYSEVISEVIIKRTGCPKDWQPLYSEIRDEPKYEYPSASPMAGSALLMGWEHVERDETVVLGMVVDEDHPFGVDVLIGTGLYHAQSAQTLYSGCDVASMAMYMLNHRASEAPDYEHSKLKIIEKDNRIEELEQRVDELEEASEAHRDRAEQLASINDSLRTHVNNLENLTIGSYENGGFRNMLEQPQNWRPPKNDEILRLRDHISAHWDTVTKEPDKVPNDRAAEIIEESYIIVLDDYPSVVTGVEDKMMFVLFKSDGLYCTYLFNEEGDGLKEVKQKSNAISPDPAGEIVVSFGDGD